VLILALMMVALGCRWSFAHCGLNIPARNICLNGHYPVCLPLDSRMHASDWTRGRPISTLTATHAGASAITLVKFSLVLQCWWVQWGFLGRMYNFVLLFDLCWGPLMLHAQGRTTLRCRLWLTHGAQVKYMGSL
jgi:hypothetical protein